MPVRLVPDADRPLAVLKRRELALRVPANDDDLERRCASRAPGPVAVATLVGVAALAAAREMLGANCACVCSAARWTAAAPRLGAEKFRVRLIEAP
mmetsp:Transcript_36443/g.104815  ORF Transcript_36443/g.104815 Transcript_36443/m.104815 type:complete len:96 (+) Transcript_36443:983-1270(+)